MSTKCPKQAIRSKMIRSRISAVGTVPSEVALDGDKHPALFRLIPHFLQHALAKAPGSQPAALPHLSAVSSSVVRDIASYGKDVSQYLPQPSSAQSTSATDNGIR